MHPSVPTDTCMGRPMEFAKTYRTADIMIDMSPRSLKTINGILEFPTTAMRAVQCNVQVLKLLTSSRYRELTIFLGPMLVGRGAWWRQLKFDGNLNLGECRQRSNSAGF